MPSPARKYSQHGSKPLLAEQVGGQRLHRPLGRGGLDLRQSASALLNHRRNFPFPFPWLVTSGEAPCDAFPQAGAVRPLATLPPQIRGGRQAASQGGGHDGRTVDLASTERERRPPVSLCDLPGTFFAGNRRRGRVTFPKGGPQCAILAALAVYQNLSLYRRPHKGSHA
jgi:hypothetical protein